MGAVRVSRAAPQERQAADGNFIELCELKLPEMRSIRKGGLRKYSIICLVGLVHQSSHHGSMRPEKGGKKDT